MNLFNIAGVDGSTFDWNNPQNGMSLTYSMRLLNLASQERFEADRLPQSTIDRAYEFDDFYFHFNNYCSNVNSIINRHMYMNLTIEEGYDLRGYDESGNALFDGNSITESISWTFELLEKFLSISEGDLDFIKNSHLPVNHVSEKKFLVLMYKVIHCFSKRLHLNGIVYNRNIEYYKAFSLGYQQPVVQSKRSRYTDPETSTFQELIDECNNIFGFRLDQYIVEYNGVLANRNIPSPFWRYTLGYSIYPEIDPWQNPNFLETVSRTLYNFTRRGGGSTLDYFGGIIDFKINHLGSINGGLFYGQQPMQDGSYKAWIAGDAYSDYGWYNLQSVDGDYTEETYYSDSNYDYKKIQDLPLFVNDDGSYTTDMIKMRDTSYESFEEVTEPEQTSFEGASIQVIPYGEINSDYYSDFITE